MSILEELNGRIITEYKGGDPEKRVFLQTLKASLLNKQKEGHGELTPEDEMKVLKTELKNRQEALEQFKSGGREDLVAKNAKEIDELKKMLPAEMPEEELEKIVSEAITESEDKSFGAVMKLAMQKVAGRADGGKVAQIVKKLTS